MSKDLAMFSQTKNWKRTNKKAIADELLNFKKVAE